MKNLVFILLDSNRVSQDTLEIIGLGFVVILAFLTVIITGGMLAYFFIFKKREAKPNQK